MVVALKVTGALEGEEDAAAVFDIMRRLAMGLEKALKRDAEGSEARRRVEVFQKTAESLSVVCTRLKKLADGEAPNDPYRGVRCQKHSLLSKENAFHSPPS